MKLYMYTHTFDLSGCELHAVRDLLLRLGDLDVAGPVSPLRIDDRDELLLEHLPDGLLKRALAHSKNPLHILRVRLIAPVK